MKSAFMKDNQLHSCNPQPVAKDCQKQQEQKVIDQMVSYFQQLLAMQQDGNLVWNGTKRDLMEATHIVWNTGRIADSSGRPMAFISMLRQLCRVLQTDIPHSPSAFVSSLSRRKNIRSCSVLDRYTRQMANGLHENPFQLEVGQIVVPQLH